MDLERAKALIVAERERVASLLARSTGAHLEDNAAEQNAGDADIDGAQPLAQEEVDIAIERSLQGRLEALSRAEGRLAAGTYGLSIESGLPIPDERLEIDPAAELTFDEADRHQHHDY